MITKEDLIIAGYKSMQGYPDTMINRSGDVYMNKKHFGWVKGGRSWNIMGYYEVVLKNKRRYSKMSLGRALLILFAPIDGYKNYVAENISGNTENTNISNFKWSKRCDVIEKNINKKIRKKDRK